MPVGILASLLLCSALPSAAVAQDVNQIRWKSEAQVRQILGEPISTTPPVGTHATYTLWRYDGYTVAFANSKAFHLFRTDSLNTMELNENRAEGS
ncbi:hypothetical protein GCM10008090_07370 [Arenicella chitinivorans]|uniref:Outer membrane protein assembly factor BamE n=1 Tax=Arenicella chitinivorans TaxID=1329800 RepID=A0A918RKS7_9GAMM|nr:hypothetical protein [Arenicella chitinivorans]GHA00846.1 hypothetical protein GCM10008090_07370 [Arenicella chitinivorans]